jgi:hypothetical protein
VIGRGKGLKRSLGGHSGRSLWWAYWDKPHPKSRNTCLWFSSSKKADRRNVSSYKGGLGSLGPSLLCRSTESVTTGRPKQPCRMEQFRICSNQGTCQPRKKPHLSSKQFQGVSVYLHPTVSPSTAWHSVKKVALFLVSPLGHKAKSGTCSSEGLVSILLDLEPCWECSLELQGPGGKEYNRTPQVLRRSKNEKKVTHAQINNL